MDPTENVTQARMVLADQFEERMGYGPDRYKTVDQMVQDLRSRGLVSGLEDLVALAGGATAKSYVAAEAALAAAGFVGPGQRARIDRLARVLTDHPAAVLELCGDERTGRRFGDAARRRGHCAKVGHRTYHYQIWATWPIGSAKGE